MQLKENAKEELKEENLKGEETRKEEGKEEKGKRRQPGKNTTRGKLTGQGSGRVTSRRETRHRQADRVGIERSMIKRRLGQTALSHPVYL